MVRDQREAVAPEPDPMERVLRVACETVLQELDRRERLRAARETADAVVAGMLARRGVGGGA